MAGRYTLIWTALFERMARRFLRKNPDLKPEFELIIRRLEIDPFDPQLKLHSLKGKLKGKHAVSITYSHRVVLVLKVSQKEIILLYIGTHDEVYR
jgi:mRNA-degrading endonuclease YafQ of YafQ-DinJ toxin-antitoxin module